MSVKTLLVGYKEEKINVEKETGATKVTANNFQKYLMFGFSIAFITAIIAIALFVPNPTAFQYTVFRVVLALFAAGTAIMIPGALEIQMKNWLKASGALAVFVIVYFYSLASLVLNPNEKSQTVNVENKSSS